MRIESWIAVCTFVPAGATAVAVWAASLYGGGAGAILATAIAVPICATFVTQTLLGRPIRSARERMRALDRGFEGDGLREVLDRAADLAQEASTFDAHMHERIEAARRQTRQQTEEMMATTVHELRTPLTTIIAALDMLRDGYASSEEDRQSFMDQASSASHHMLFVINDLLDSAALDAGKIRMHLGTCYCNDILDDARRIMEPMAVVRGIELVCEKPTVDVAVRADQNRVLQVLFNLMGNALKFTPEGSRVGLRARAQGEHLLFEVWDEGRGLDEATRRTLFQRFSSGVHSTGNSTGSGTRSTRGRPMASTGIGLNVSQQLVRKMGGEIGYRPAESGTGSTFWFTLCRAGAESSAGKAAEPGDPEASES